MLETQALYHWATPGISQTCEMEENYNKHLVNSEGELGGGVFHLEDLMMEIKCELGFE